MNNNDILRRLRYALNLSDAKMIEIFARVGQVLNEAEVHSLLGKEDEEGTVICLDDLMAAFLDSLIVELRGPPRPGSPPPAIPDRISNNDIIKKVRIALKLQESDMMTILEAGGQPMSKGELSALFRKPGHKHYRACGDQVMRAFLRGLTLRLRPSK
jgi:uncharacterized protein YehS (DUF1456 family)